MTNGTLIEFDGLPGTGKSAAHLRRGLTVIADAVSPVAVARLGWRDPARSVRARHVGFAA